MDHPIIKSLLRHWCNLSQIWQVCRMRGRRSVWLHAQMLVSQFQDILQDTRKKYNPLLSEHGWAYKIRWLLYKYWLLLPFDSWWDFPISYLTILLWLIICYWVIFRWILVPCAKWLQKCIHESSAGPLHKRCSYNPPLLALFQIHKYCTQKL